MNFRSLNSLKIRITLIFSLLLAIAFGINWQLATKTIDDEKVEDLQSVLRHLLIESHDEYIVGPLDENSDLRFLHAIPHNILILKDSEASNTRFVVRKTPYTPAENEISASIRLANSFFLSVISDHRKIDAAVAKYKARLLIRYTVSLCLILLISIAVLQRYIRPLGVLTECVREWKSGEPFVFPIRSAGQEIDELAGSFTTLVHSLEGFRTKEKALFKEMAHELKTPIALMRARLDVYENSDEFSKEKMINELGHDLERLMSELKNVLFFENIDFDDVMRFELSDTLAEVIQKVEVLAQRRGLSIVMPKESFSVYAPRTLFVKVIMALIENSLTYAKEKSDIILEIDKEKKSLTISNQKGGEKYLFSSKIGQKMLDRVSQKVGIGYQICDEEEWYRVRVSILK